MTGLAILGCGSMATGILTGLLRNPKDRLAVSKVTACVRTQASADRLQALFGSSTIPISPIINDNARAVAEADVVLLGHNPWQLTSVLGEKGMSEAFKGKKIISILAGISAQQIAQALNRGGSDGEGIDVVRAMPNVGASIGESMTLFSEPRDASTENLEFAKTLFNSIGRTIEVSDAAFASATVLASAAYAMTTVALEGMLDGAIQQGLPRDSAVEISAQCFKGLAAMLQQGQHPALIRDLITPPSSITLTGVVELNKGAVRSAFAEAVIKATGYAKEFGQRQD